MEGLFPEYADSELIDYAAIWKSALFVFDTNVLLSLYRYRLAARDELLAVLSELSERIWIPHHVALEFQRNRLNVIADQNKKFSDVRSIVVKSKALLSDELEKLQLKKRHSVINPDIIVDGFNTLAESFLADLAVLEDGQQKLTEVDPIKRKIDTLFKNRVGDPPESQEILDKLYKAAEVRYKVRIPPGFEDQSKEKSDSDEYAHGGLVYKKKYGDYLVWAQLLHHVKDKNIKSLVYITGDTKRDWWHKIEVGAPKLIGPRPELIEEARRIGDVDSFLMYTPEKFLKYSKELLKADVSEDTLAEVRDVSSVNSHSEKSSVFRPSIAQAMDAGIRWLVSSFDDVDIEGDFPDFVVQDGRRSVGYEILIPPHDPKHTVVYIFGVAEKARSLIDEGRFDEVVLVMIVADESEAMELNVAIKQPRREKFPPGVRVMIAFLSFDDDHQPVLNPRF